MLTFKPIIYIQKQDSWPEDATIFQKYLLSIIISTKFSWFLDPCNSTCVLIALYNKNIIKECCKGAKIYSRWQNYHNYNHQEMLFPIWSSVFFFHIFADVFFFTFLTKQHQMFENVFIWCVVSISPMRIDNKEYKILRSGWHIRRWQSRCVTLQLHIYCFKRNKMCSGIIYVLFVSQNCDILRLIRCLHIKCYNFLKDLETSLVDINTSLSYKSSSWDCSKGICSKYWNYYWRSRN